MVLEMLVKSLISKEICSMKGTREKRSPRIFSALAFYLPRIRNTLQAQIRKNRVRTVVIAVRIIIRVIETHRNELERTREVIKKAHSRQTLRAFRGDVFFSFGETLSLTCTAVISFLFAFLAEINRAYNKVSRRRSGEVPGREVNRRGEGGAILSKNASCEEEHPDSVN